MRIAHVTSSISRIGAGVAKVVRDLAEAQAGNNDPAHIFTLLDQFTQGDQPDLLGITVSACPVTLSARFGYSRTLQKTLDEQAGSIDVIHMHGLWMYPNKVAGNVALKAAIPYIMSPHGMLDSRSLGMKQWKKRITGFLFEYANIGRAACLHACSELEAEHLRSFGYKGPVAVVTTGLSTSELTNTATVNVSANEFHEKFPHLSKKRIALYLSRLHEQKGVHFLLDAWQSVAAKFPDWHIVIAGGGEQAYIAALENSIKRQGLADSVTFIGPVHGDAKWNLLRLSSMFVLPSYSENFGLVVAEALACGVPVITTKGTPWIDLKTEECGWWIDIGAKPLEECFINALTLSVSRLTEMGERGRRLVETKYMIDNTASKMRGVYEWMLKAGPVPDCVRLD